MSTPHTSASSVSTALTICIDDLGIPDDWELPSSEAIDNYFASPEPSSVYSWSSDSASTVLRVPRCLSTIAETDREDYEECAYMDEQSDDGRRDEGEQDDLSSLDLESTRAVVGVDGEEEDEEPEQRVRRRLNFHICAPPGHVKIGAVTIDDSIAKQIWAHSFEPRDLYKLASYRVAFPEMYINFLSISDPLNTYFKIFNRGFKNMEGLRHFTDVCMEYLDNLRYLADEYQVWQDVLDYHFAFHEKRIAEMHYHKIFLGWSSVDGVLKRKFLDDRRKIRESQQRNIRER